MDMLSFMLGKALGGGGGGGSSIEVEALTATENKTYTAPEGKAYSPVTVNVPIPVGGLEYETGTWTPSENTSTANISFANQHTNLPIFAMLVDAVGDNDNTFNTNYYWSVFNIVGLTNKTIPATETEAKGIYCRSYRTNNANQTITNGTSLVSDDSTSKYSLNYYLRTNGFTADNNLTGSLSVVWRSGRTYKWIAVWAPTT